MADLAVDTASAVATAAADDANIVRSERKPLQSNLAVGALLCKIRAVHPFAESMR